MNSKTEMENIDTYEVIKWKRFYSVFQDNFKSLLGQIDVEHEFGNDYLRQMGDRLRELIKFNYRLSTVFFIVVLIMGVIDSGVIEEISIFGIKISGDNSTLAVLLLISSLLTLVTSTVSLMETHYKTIIKSIVDVQKNEKVSDYFNLQFTWSFNALSEGFYSDDKLVIAKVFVGAIATLMVANFVIVAVVVGVLQFFILVSSIILRLVTAAERRCL